MHVLLLKELLLLQIQIMMHMARNWFLKIVLHLFLCISKRNNTLTHNVEEDLDIVKLMYNLLEHSNNYSKATRSSWNYYRDEISSGAVGNINYSIIDSKTFDYKTSITRKFENYNTEKEDVETVVPVKHLCNFWIAID